jgi:hypothetical protein
MSGERVNSHRFADERRAGGERIGVCSQFGRGAEKVFISGSVLINDH